MDKKLKVSFHTAEPVRFLNDSVNNVADIRVQRSQKTPGIEPMLDQCSSVVYDGGPTLPQHRFNVLCFPGYHHILHHLHRI